MLTRKDTYRHIFKATGLFGGVQLIQILSLLIRAKFIAIFLGPAGMGISSLLLSTTAMIGNLAGLGLNFSAVRDISQANETQDIHSISRKIKVVRRWLWVCGAIGMLATIAFAPQLSQFAFESKEFTWAFVWLSCTLLLNTLTAGNIALLRGMNRLKDLAKATIVGSFVGLASSLPLYAYYGINGIVPALIIASLSAYLASLVLSRKIRQVPVSVSAKETFREGQEMAKLGVVMMISLFIGSFVTYLLNAFISHTGGIRDVGLYQAGISVTNQYVGLVFGAMSVDYFPRLSAINGENSKVRALANQQSEIIILIVAPLVIALIVTAPLVIRILLSPEFYPITDLVRLIALGMLFKAASFAVGYISFAKGDKKVFLIVEGIVGNLLTLTLNVLGYYYWGLVGLGMSFLLSYILYFALILGVTRRLYDFTLDIKFIRLFLLLLILCTAAFLVMTSADNLFTYVIGGAILVTTTVASCWEMDKRIGLRNFASSLWNRRKN